MSGFQTSRDEINLAGSVWSPSVYYPAGTQVLRLLELPSWTLATRPVVGLNPGRTGFNTDLGTQETWNGTLWAPTTGGLVGGSAVLSWPSAASAVVTNGAFTIALSWPWQSSAFLNVVAQTRVGSFTVGLLVNGTSVAGLGSVLVNTATPATTQAYANAITGGSTVVLAVSNAIGSPTDATVQINYQRSAI